MTAEHVVPVGTLKQVALKDIKVPARFRIDYGDMETFCASIQEKGILQPITLSSDYVLLAGGRRFKAATVLGLDKIPALVRKVVGEELDNREIELVENTFRKDFTWQEEAALIADIDRLYKAKDMNWSGRKTAELLDKSVNNIARKLELADAIKAIPELGEQATASDAYKILKKMEEEVVTKELVRRQQAALSANEANNPAAVAGDAPVPPAYATREFHPDLKQRLQFANSNYRIGDAFAGLAELRTEGMVHVIECDPPYGIDLALVKGSKEAVDSNVHTYNEVDQKDYVAFLTKLCKELYRVAARDAWCIFWFGPTWHTEVKHALVDAGWHVDDIPAVWIKGQGQTLQPEVYLARAYEPFFVCRKGRPVLVKRGRSNVFSFAGVAGQLKYHPTQRPLELMEEVLSTFAMPGQVVLSPFLGSGTTLRAAYKNQLKAMGWDLSGEYKDKFMLNVEADFTPTNAETANA